MENPTTTSHKEGGTNISWNGEHGARPGLRAGAGSDHGDHPDTIMFPSEPDFLEALRKFYAWETAKNVYSEKVSELVAWKPMLRLLRT